MRLMFYTNQKHLDESEHVPITNFHHLDRFYTLSDFLDAPCSSELFRSSRLGVSIYTPYMTLEHEYLVMKFVFYTNRNHLDESEYVQRTHFAHINRFLTLSDFLEAPYTSLSVSPACMACLSALLCLSGLPTFPVCLVCLCVMLAVWSVSVCSCLSFLSACLVCLFGLFCLCLNHSSLPSAAISQRNTFRWRFNERDIRLDSSNYSRIKVAPPVISTKLAKYLS